jgi:hypothetical protein
VKILQGKVIYVKSLWLDLLWQKCTVKEIICTFDGSYQYQSPGKYH